MSKIRVRRQFKQHIHVHNDLARGAKHFRDTVRAKLAEGDELGISFDVLAELIFLAFSIEARLNFLGDKLISGWDERQGAQAKLKRVLSHLNAMTVNRATMVFARGLGDKVVVSVQNAAHLDIYNELQPDLVLIRPRENFYGTRHPRPEDVVLLIEVSETTLRYDRNVKLPIYARRGVPEVWIIDLKNEAIHTYRNPEGKAYGVTETKRRGASVSPCDFPDFTIKVDDLLG